MAAQKPPSKIVVVQAGVSTTNGNGAIPNAGYKVHTSVMPVPQRNKPWFPRWHQEHPKN